MENHSAVPSDPEIAIELPASSQRARRFHFFLAPEWVTALSTVGLLVATICYTAVSTGQLIQLNKQSSISIASLRPWIKIKSINLRPGYAPIKTLMFHWPLTGALTQPELQTSVTLENVGDSVAQNVQVETWLLFTPFVSDKLHQVVFDYQEQMCSHKHIRRNDDAISLFPSYSYQWAGGPGAPMPKQDSAAAVILCVYYNDASGSLYRTEARAGLYENRNVIIKTGVDADASELQLIRDASGDHAY